MSVRAQPEASIAVVGTPNAGKSTLFNRLTGLRQRIGNYPGVTVEKHVGTLLVGDQKLEL
ncbi:MAG: FeoB small GTPase domain-containing protein, partial [Pseudomonadota bacterium]